MAQLQQDNANAGLAAVMHREARRIKVGCISGSRTGSNAASFRTPSIITAARLGPRWGGTI